MSVIKPEFEATVHEKYVNSDRFSTAERMVTGFSFSSIKDRILSGSESWTDSVLDRIDAQEARERAYARMQASIGTEDELDEVKEEEEREMRRAVMLRKLSIETERLWNLCFVANQTKHFEPLADPTINAAPSLLRISKEQLALRRKERARSFKPVTGSPHSPSERARACNALSQSMPLINEQANTEREARRIRARLQLDRLIAQRDEVLNCHDETMILDIMSKSGLPLHPSDLVCVMRGVRQSEIMALCKAMWQRDLIKQAAGMPSNNYVLTRLGSTVLEERLQLLRRVAAEQQALEKDL